jgi:hypothetical protein
MRALPKIDCREQCDPGPVPELLWLDPAELVVDDQYQRMLTVSRGSAQVRKIVREFSWRAFGALVVSAGADGRYAVLDGQHRAAAALSHGAIGRVPCVLVTGGVPEQARAFARINSDRRRLDQAQTFHALVAAGDARAVALKALLDEAGVAVQRNPHPDGVRPLHTRAIGPLNQMMQRVGEVHVLDALDMIATAHAELPNQFGGSQIWAVALVVKAIHDGQGDLDRLAAVVAGTDLEELQVKAAAYRRQFRRGTIYRHMADMLMHEYNRNLKGRLTKRLSA